MVSWKAVALVLVGFVILGAGSFITLDSYDWGISCSEGRVEDYIIQEDKIILECYAEQEKIVRGNEIVEGPAKRWIEEVEKGTYHKERSFIFGLFLIGLSGVLIAAGLVIGLRDTDEDYFVEPEINRKNEREIYY